MDSVHWDKIKADLMNWVFCSKLRTNVAYSPSTGYIAKVEYNAYFNTHTVLPVDGRQISRGVRSQINPK